MRTHPPERIRRWTVLPFIFLAAWFARGYLLDDPRRFQSATFDAPKELAAGLLRDDNIEPMRLWGLVFAAGAVALSAAALGHSRIWLRVALLIGGGIYVFWACVYTVGALSDPEASTIGPGVFLFLAGIHFLSAWYTGRQP